MPELATAAAGASAGGGLLGSIFGASSAKKAAKQQAAIANRQLDLQERVYNESVDRLAPYSQTGLRAQQALAFELGLGGRPTFSARTGGTAPANDPNALSVETRPIYETRSTPMPGSFRDNDRPTFDQQVQTGANYQVGPQNFDTRGGAEAYLDALRADYNGPPMEYGGFQQTQDYLFGLNEGVRAVDASAAARGGLNSGATLQALNQWGQDYGSQRRGQFLDRLGGLASSGQNAAAGQVSAGQFYAGGASDALGALGNAQSAGTIGFSNAITGGLNNLASLGGFLAGGTGRSRTAPLPNLGGLSGGGFGTIPTLSF